MSLKESEMRQLQKAIAGTKTALGEAAGKLRGVLQDAPMMAETPIEVGLAMELAVEAIGESLRRLDSVSLAKSLPLAPPPGGPTRQQGQFLAFIREYIKQNYGGVAPTHAAFQRFFNLTPPSVNSMLIRLEERGFIRRIPHKARAIELTVNPEWIPPLERPFKF